jgi:hypothetical protein
MSGSTSASEITGGTLQESGKTLILNLPPQLSEFNVSVGKSFTWHRNLTKHTLVSDPRSATSAVL